MQRREFSFSAATAAATAALGGAAGFSGAALAQGGKVFKAGTDYLVLDKPAPTEAAAGRVEVVEFFWYSCPHCNRFEPQFEAWMKKLPKDVAVRRVPVAFRPDFEPQQRLYYALDSLGKVDDMQMKVFNAIHNEKLPLATSEQITAWVEKQGVDKAKFVDAYNSFPVVTKVRRATQLQDSYKVQGVPALGVAGRFYTDGTQAESMERALLVVDYLVGLARKSK